MLVKQLDCLDDSQTAGIVIGGRAPIALTSQANSPLERAAACALAALAASASSRRPRLGADRQTGHPPSGVATSEGQRRRQDGS